MEVEIWKEIDGFGGIYQVSNMGRIKSFIRKGILDGSLDKDGYLFVSLKIDGKRYSKKVHRLVATAFIPNPLNKPQVNHKKGIKTDNRASELEWATASENSLHSFRTGLSTPKDLSGKNNPRYKTGINETGSFEKVCEGCGKDFIAKIKRYRFCSKSCSKNKVSVLIATYNLSLNATIISNEM